MFEEGQVYKYPFSYSQEDMDRFAVATGDNNPIYSDPEYASSTTFKRPVMHGFLAASIFPRILGTMFPGEGTIYLRQSMTFEKPMYVNTEYEAVITVKEIQKEKNRATVETVIQESISGETTIKGEATIMNVSRIGFGPRESGFGPLD